MNPLEEYISIIHQRQQNPLPKEEYGERHHIIPRSCGGCNKKWNLVRLTPEEHYRCHYLLTFIYATGEAHDKMVYAWGLMSYRCSNEEEYAALRAEFSSNMSKLQSGKEAWNKGKKMGTHPGYTKGMHWHWSEESLKRIKGKRTWMKGRHLSEETKSKMRASSKHLAPNKGRKFGPASEERRRKISEAKKAYWARRKAATG